MKNRWGTSNEYPLHMFLWGNMKNYPKYSSLITSDMIHCALPFNSSGQGWFPVLFPWPPLVRDDSLCSSLVLLWSEMIHCALSLTSSGQKWFPTHFPWPPLVTDDSMLFPWHPLVWDDSLRPSHNLIWSAMICCPSPTQECANYHEPLMCYWDADMNAVSKAKLTIMHKLTQTSTGFDCVGV